LHAEQRIITDSEVRRERMERRERRGGEERREERGDK
jgi:hypothetical protein